MPALDDALGAILNSDKAPGTGMKENQNDASRKHFL